MSAALCAVTAATQPVLYNLGTLGEGGPATNGSHANGINNAGQVVGWSHNLNGQRRAILYSGLPGSGGTMWNLGTGGTALTSIGTAINSSGDVTGSVFFSNGLQRAFRFTGAPGAGGTMVTLGALVGGFHSSGEDINDLGHVVGSSNFDQTTRFHAFLYVGTPGKDGMMHDLGSLGGLNSYGLAINNRGQIVGISETSNGQTHGFLYEGGPARTGRCRTSAHSAEPTASLQPSTRWVK